MNHFCRKVFFSAALAACFAMPVYAEEAQEFFIATVPGVDALQEELTQSETYYSPNGESPDTLPDVPEPVVDEQTGETTWSYSPTPQVAANLDPNYNGAVDTVTSLPVDDFKVNEKDGLYILEEGRMAYNAAVGQYYLYCGDAYAACSLPAGAIVNSGTSLYVYEAMGLQMSLYRNNTLLADYDNTDLIEPGYYTLNLTDNGGNTVSYSFILTDGPTNIINEIRLPKGFRFGRVIRDGVEQTLEFSNYVDLMADGHYLIDWSCPTINKYYTAEFTLDHVAPTLALPEVEKGFADKEVTLTDLEEGATILCTVDGQQRTITDPNEMLSAPGRYTLTIIDRAGNSTTYDFRIKTRLDFPAGLAIALLVGALVFVLIYSFRLHRYARVY